MATFKEVMEKARQADAAGNTEDAQRLVNIARRIKAATPTQESISPSGPLPFLNQAIARTVGAPVDLVTGGLGLIPGAKEFIGPEPFGGSKQIERGMKAIGALLPEEGRTPETIPEFIGAGIGEVAGLMIPGAMVTKTLSTGSGLVGGITNNIWQGMVRHPHLTMVSEITGGAGVGLGRAIGEKEFPESPTARVTSEIIGGVAGSLVPIVAVHAPAAVAIRQGRTLLKKISLPFTKEGARFRAGEFIKGQVAEPEVVARAIGEETISDLPPAIQAGEKRLQALYKNMIGQDPVSDAEAIESLSKSMIELERQMRKLGYGSPELLREITQKRVAAIELGMDNRVTTAMQKAQDTLNRVPVAQRKGAEAKIVENELRKGMQQEQKRVQAIWKEVPLGLDVDVENTRLTFNSIVDDTAHAQRGDIPSILKGDPIVAKKGLTSTTLREMQGLRSKMLEIERIARKNSLWNRARIASDIADAILEDIGNSGPGVESLQTALAATRQFKARYESGIVAEILGFSKSGAPTISPELTLDISLGRMGQRGAIDINKVVITPEAVAATERYLGRSFTDYAADIGTGKINPIKSERWVRNNEAILDQFPNLRKRMIDATKAQELADTTRVRMDARKKALQDPNISISARFLNKADMGIEVEGIFKSKNPLKMTVELVRQSRKDTTGRALEGLRGGMIDYMLEKSSVGAYNELGEQTLSGRTLLNFINKNELALREAFTTEQIIRMRRIGKELTQIEIFDKITATKSGIEMTDLPSNALRIFARITGARLGGRLGKESVGGSLQMAGIFSGRAKAWIDRLVKDRAAAMIHDAILSKDPALLQSLLLPLDKPGIVTQENLNILNRRLNLWLAGTGKRVWDDIVEESETDTETQQEGQGVQ